MNSDPCAYSVFGKEVGNCQFMEKMDRRDSGLERMNTIAEKQEFEAGSLSG